jgi:hypothetical protein
LIGGSQEKVKAVIQAYFIAMSKPAFLHNAAKNGGMAG